MAELNAYRRKVDDRIVAQERRIFEETTRDLHRGEPYKQIVISKSKDLPTVDLTGDPDLDAAGWF